MNTSSDSIFDPKTSDDSFLRDSSSLSTAALETVLERSDLITPTLPNGLKGMDSGFFADSLEEYRLSLENHWQSERGVPTALNSGDFLTGQNGFGVLSSSVDYAGNTLSTARAITVGSTATSYTDWVGSTDTNDYYRFSLTNTSNFNLGLTGLISDADVELLNSSGSLIVDSTNSGTTSESISRQLNAGTYYIRVFPYGGSTNYNLSVSAASLAPVDNAGNTLSTARTITVGSSATSYTDWVGSTDTNDYYRFSLTNTSNFNLGLTGLTSDANVQLLDGSSNTIVSSSNSGTASESITRQLNAGTYYIRVFPYSGSTNYNLSVSAAPLAPVDNAGNTPNTARAITVGSTATTYTDWVGSTDTNDYYRFSLTNTSNFNLGLTGLTSDANVQLLDGSSNTIVSSSNSGTASESITRQLNAGTYYIRVFPYSGSTNYNLSVSAATVTQPSFSILRGDLRANTFDIQSGSNYLISGNGNVDFGQGYRDLLNLSNISSSSVTLNRSTSTGGGVLYNPGNGTRLFDALSLSNGNQILFEGIDQIRFQDTTLNLSVQPNDPLFNQQWNLHMMGVQNAWRFTTGSSRILIGVEDTGLGMNSSGNIHPDLGSNTYFYSDNVRDEFFSYGKPQPYETQSHGTAVQGIIAAKGNNGIGGSGINWNSDVFSIDVLGGNAYDQNLGQATQNMINFANSRGQKLIVNMSLGGGGRDSIFEQLVANNRNNALFVIATGNEDRNSLSYPALLSQSYDNVISVGASWGTRDVKGNSKTPGTRISYPNWWGSNYGTGLTLMGPSEVITTEASPTTNPNIATFSYDTDFNGTSAATPNVAGVASLVWSVNPNLTAGQIKQILSQTAYDLGTPGYDLVYGSGFVNADAAVRRALAISRTGGTSAASVSSLNSQYSVSLAPSNSLAVAANTQGNLIANAYTIQSTQAVAQSIERQISAVEPIVKEIALETVFLETNQSRQLNFERFEQTLTVQWLDNEPSLPATNLFETTQVPQPILEDVEKAQAFQPAVNSQKIQKLEPFLFTSRYDELTGICSLQKQSKLGELDQLVPSLFMNA